MKVWITKYALTQNIYECDVEPFEDSGMVSGKGMFEHYHGEGREWHRTKEGAIAKAEAMRVAKVKSLQKSIAKLEKLIFG